MQKVHKPHSGASSADHIPSHFCGHLKLAKPYSQCPFTNTTAAECRPDLFLSKQQSHCIKLAGQGPTPRCRLSPSCSYLPFGINHKTASQTVSRLPRRATPLHHQYHIDKTRPQLAEWTRYWTGMQMT